MRILGLMPTAIARACPGKNDSVQTRGRRALGLPVNGALVASRFNLLAKRMLMKFAVGSFIVESNTFSPQSVNLDYLRSSGYLLFGNEILEKQRGLGNELGGFLDAAQQSNIELAGICAAWSIPHGIVESKTYHYLKNEFLSRIGACKGIDGVYLALHGSMVAEGIDDPEGDLLQQIRGLVGRRPLVVSLDFHANLTQKMARNAEIIIGYNTFPHTNMYQIGQKAARLAQKYQRRRTQIETIMVKLPLIAPLERLTTIGGEPLAAIADQVRLLEEKEGIWCASLFGVHYWLDVEELGASLVTVVSQEHAGYARREISRIAAEFWADRKRFFDLKLYSLPEAIEEALRIKDSPVILNESADNVGAGASGDSTYVLQALLEMKVSEPTILTIVDPQAVEKLIKAGVGEVVEIAIGGKLTKRFSKPIGVKGKVRTIFEGRYRYHGPVYRGVETSMGRTVVLEVNANIFVQLTELPVFTLDPEHYRCVGLLPERMKIVVVKSQGSFRACYDEISKRVFYLDTPGLSTSNLGRLSFTKVRKGDLYPFNKNLKFSPRPLTFRA